MTTSPRRPLHRFLVASDRPGVRPEIQALRAFAVLAVVLYHLWPHRLPGGFVGVDVFFVISGFLITSHLVREVSGSGSIDLPRFWARRARRLLPASFLVIAATAIASVLIVPASLWQQYFREFGASALYIVNWVLAADSVDYLAAENTASPVQHYWSLAVEEQFYLVWPLLILLASAIIARVARTRAIPPILVVLGTVTVASLAYSIYLTSVDPAPAYFVTPVRAWEFGVGSLLGVISTARAARGDEAIMKPALATAISWAGIAILFVTVFTYSENVPFPGWTALLPVLGTAAVIAGGSPATRLSPAGLMRLRPVQWLGDISYSLYLWHWPLVVLVPLAIDRPPGTVLLVAMLAVSIALAALTKRFVEDPVRRSPWLVAARARRTLGLTAAGMALIVGVSAATWTGLEIRFQESINDTQSLMASNPDCFGAAALDPAHQPCVNPDLAGKLVPEPGTAELDEVIRSGCRIGARQAGAPSCSLATGASNRPRVALVGDSHAEHWAPALVTIAEARGWSVDTYLKGGCSFSTAQRNDQNPEAVSTCTDWNKRVLDTIEQEGYDLVVMSASVDKEYTTLPGQSSYDAAVAGMVEQWNRLEDATGIPMLAIRDNPHMPFNVPDCLSGLGGDVLELMATKCSAPEKSALPADPQIAAAEATGVALADLTPFFCPDGTCVSTAGSVVIYRDTDHLGGTYSRSLAPYLADAIDRVLGTTG